MSTGYTNNNYGNLNYSGDDWEGWTGAYTITADGQHNLVFINPIYGIRALMVDLSNKIKSGLTNTSDILRKYSPMQSDKDRTERATYINNKYFAGALPENDILDLSDNCIMNLTKGIIATEIPEWKQIPQNYYDAALRYYNSGDDTEAKQFNSPVIDNSSTIVLLVIAAGIITIISKYNHKL